MLVEGLLWKGPVKVSDHGLRTAEDRGYTRPEDPHVGDVIGGGTSKLHEEYVPKRETSHLEPTVFEQNDIVDKRAGRGECSCVIIQPVGRQVVSSSDVFNGPLHDSTERGDRVDVQSRLAKTR